LTSVAPARPPALLVRRAAARVVDAGLAFLASYAGLAYLHLGDGGRPAALVVGAAYLVWCAWYLLSSRGWRGGSSFGQRLLGLVDRTAEPRRRWWQVAIMALAGFGALSSPCVAQVGGGLGEAKVRTARTDLQAMCRRVEALELAYGRTPSTLDELGGNFARVRDPWGRRYRYAAAGRGDGRQRIVVGSLGADGEPGGDGERADLVETCGSTAAPTR